MDTIINNPGLQHLVEKVFWNLDVEDLKICAHINQSCKQILQNPIPMKYKCRTKMIGYFFQIRFVFFGHIIKTYMVCNGAEKWRTSPRA